MRKKRGYIALQTSIVIVAFLLAGCKKAKTIATGHIMTEPTNSSEEITATQGADSTEKTPELKKADIEQLAANNIFNVNWYTKDGDYKAGTAFLLDSKQHKEKLLVTAFHLFEPENENDFSAEKLPDYILGGEIDNAFSDENTGATLKSCLVIKDAEAVPEVNKDVAAFTIQDGEQLPTIPISESGVKAGDTIYLLASLWKSDKINDNCVYEGTVVSEEDGVVYFNLDDNYGLTGSSGGPIVNENGEVVAIQMASNNSNLCAAHAAASFMDQINRAEISEITYPKDLASFKGETGQESENNENEDDKPQALYFTREQAFDTSFFTSKLDQVMITDQVGDRKAEAGKQFLVVTIALDSKAEGSNEIDMYDSDFWVAWGEGDEEYAYPLEPGISQKQLGKQYLIYADKTTTGDLIFEIPADLEQVQFLFLDYYVDPSTNELIYGDMYVMNLPVENWKR